MKQIITISRQYASGGRTIGKAVAQRLGFAFYDTQIIRDTMRRTGLAAQTVEDTEQRVTNSFLFNLVMGVDIARNNMKKIEQAEREIIREYVKQGPCVIVGRSANFVLEDVPTEQVLNAYIYAGKAERIAYAVRHYGVEESQAKRRIEQTDKERRLYTASFYGKEWGDKQNYDLLINSGSLGLAACVDILCRAAEAE